MSIFLFAALVVGLIYSYLIHFLLGQWEEIPEWTIPEDFQPKTTVSILIPARNEAANILHCLNCLLRQEFPADLFEIIVIDDHSTDATAELVCQLEHPNLRLLQLSGIAQGKKAALAHGIQAANGTLILTTDADCSLPIGWLAGFVSYYEKHDPVFMTGPVVFQPAPNALERFQALDMMGTMLITGAGIHSRTMHMSNGANLAYPKTIFESVDGFSGIDHLASGDDMLLMHKIQRAYPGRVAFLKCRAAIVSTPAVKGWKAFLQQRLRWATKSGTYQDWWIIVVLGIVFLLCWGILLSPFLIFFYGWWGIGPFLILFLMKSAADYRLLGRAGRYFHREELMQYFLQLQWLHIFYIAGIGLLANLVKRYEWKGRRQR